MSKKTEETVEQQFQREAPIKTEVIMELREQNAQLWATEATLLEALIMANDALRVYRLSALERARMAAASSGRCVPGCTKHEWHTDDGWRRKGEGKQ